MKKHLFIPAVFLCTVFFGHAQQNENAEHINVKQPSNGSLLVFSSFTVVNTISLPPNGPVVGYAGNQLIFKGQVRKQKLNAGWQSRYTNNKLLDSGFLKNGIPDGEWRRWDSSGQLLSIRNYDAAKLQRVKEEIRINHPKRSFYALMSLYKTNRQQALRYLTAAYSFSILQKQETVQSLLELVERNTSGHQNYTPVFNECLQHGLYMNFFPGGIAKDSGYYKNGLREAVWLHRNSPGGHYFTGSYKNGLPHREWKQYDATGKLYAIVFYNKDGQVEWTKKISR